MSEIEFADGMIFKKPHRNAPDFVVGSISIKVEDFVQWLDKQKARGGWVNLNVKESKGGKVYIALDTWEPDRKDRDDEPRRRRF